MQQGVLMMEAARTSETLVNFYQTTRRYNPEDSHLHSRRRQNLKSYLCNMINPPCEDNVFLEPSTQFADIRILDAKYLRA
jgi:hypothetical protein